MPSIVPTVEPSTSNAPSPCPLVNLTFAELVAGTYVNDQLDEVYGITFSAKSTDNTGYTPNDSARVLGTGVTDVDNVVMVQSGQTSMPRWNENGGSITIHFAQPVELQEIGILRTLTTQSDLNFTIVYADGTSTDPDPHYEEAKDWDFFEQDGTEEVLYRVYLTGEDVKSLTVSGDIQFAITEIQCIICGMDTRFPTVSPTERFEPTYMPDDDERSLMPVSRDESYAPSMATTTSLPPIFAPTDQPDFVCVDEEYMSSDQPTVLISNRREL